MTTTTKVRCTFPRRAPRGRARAADEPDAARLLAAGLLAALAVLAAASPASAELSDGRPGPCAASPLVTTAGAGSATVPADGASVSVRVEASGPTPSAASAAMTERIEAVLAALEAAGADARTTTGYSLHTVNHHETSEVIGYNAVSGVVVTVADLSKLSSYLEAALAGGATSISHLEFTSNREREAHDRALAAAYAEAAADAKVLADAAGVRLGPLVELSTAPGPVDTYYEKQIVVTGTVPQLESPQVEVHATVHAQWCLAPPSR